MKGTTVFYLQGNLDDFKWSQVIHKNIEKDLFSVNFSFFFFKYIKLFKALWAKCYQKNIGSLHKVEI